MQAVSTFPKVVEVEGIEDACLDAHCPHCGAMGRYIVRFVTESGAHMGAMRGCFQLFPKSKYALRTQKLLDKERTSRFGLASWDKKVLEAVRSLPELGEVQVDRLISEADLAKHNYIAGRYGRR